MGWEAFFYGGLAAVSAEVCSYPLDTSKIRLQIQGQLADATLSATKYRGMSHTLVLVAQEEGIKSLYNGVKYAALRQATYGTIRFGIFFSGKSWWNNRGGSDRDLPFMVGLGVIAGAVGSYITTPIDMMKVRSQSNSKPQPIIATLLKTYRFNGISGLYQGKWPNVKRASVVNGIEIPAYVSSKSYMLEKLHMKDGKVTQFYSAAFASLVGIMCSQPFDVAKTRIMQQKPYRTDILMYEGFFDMMRRTIRTEGVLALWKGIVPAYCRNGPWNIVFYLTLEQLRRFDNHINNREQAVF